MQQPRSPQTVIPPVPDGTPRPLWSVMIPTYNCARYLRETLASVLAQDPGPEVMQIEVVDDCSTIDDPLRVVEEVGQGRVSFYRQPTNVGHVKNFNTCLHRAQGHLIHLLHGDDSVLDGYYQTLARTFADHAELGAAFCRHIWMDEQGQWQFISGLLQPASGILDDGLAVLASKQRIQAPAIAVRRSVYESVGGFDPRIRYCGEDWEMWVRIAAHYPLWYETRPLAAYRTHTASLARRSTHTGDNIRDVLRAIEIFRAYLPPACATQLANQARENCGMWAIKSAHMALDAGDTKTVFIQAREALRCSHSPSTLTKVARLLIRFVRYLARKAVRRSAVVGSSAKNLERQ